jgi:hypothetical protein
LTADYYCYGDAADSVIGNAIRLGHVQAIGTVRWYLLWTVTPSQHPLEHLSNLPTTLARNPIDPKWMTNGRLDVPSNGFYGDLFPSIPVISNLQVDWGQLVRYVEAFAVLTRRKVTDDLLEAKQAAVVAWLQEEVFIGSPAQVRKDDVRKEAKTNFGISGRNFDKLWDQYAPDRHRRGGRRRKIIA